MEHIPQKFKEGDCGIATIALATNVTYERVLESVAPDACQHGIWVAELLHSLKKITGEEWSTKYYSTTFPQLSQYEFPKCPAVYGVIRLEAGNKWHYVFSDGEYFYDPLLPDKITIEQAKLDYHSGWCIMVEIKK